MENEKRFIKYYTIHFNRLEKFASLLFVQLACFKLFFKIVILLFLHDFKEKRQSSNKKNISNLPQYLKKNPKKYFQSDKESRN